MRCLHACLPALAPIVVVLKALLNRHHLKSAFTGGLSSYALLLMVVRYLQEQLPQQSGDVGSLLMGFLSFYSQHFDPRTTGISIADGFFARHAGPARTATDAAPRPAPRPIPPSRAGTSARRWRPRRFLM